MTVYVRVVPLPGSVSDVAGKRAQRVAARAAARTMLADHLGVDPANVGWVRDAHGRPHPHPTCGLDVNLTHTAGLAVVALSGAGPVGVDAERVRPLRHLPGTAAEILADAEHAAWDGGTGTFLTWWTRKEAVLKAHGSGGSGTLRAIVTGAAAARAPTALPGVPSAGVGSAVEVLALPAGWGDPGGWTVADLTAVPGYRIAVACRAPETPIRIG